MYSAAEAPHVEPSPLVHNVRHLAQGLLLAHVLAASVKGVYAYTEVFSKAGTARLREALLFFTFLAIGVFFQITISVCGVVGAYHRRPTLLTIFIVFAYLGIVLAVYNVGLFWYREFWISPQKEMVHQGVPIPSWHFIGAALYFVVQSVVICLSFASAFYARVLSDELSATQEATSLLPLPVSNRDANGKVEESGWMPYLPFSLPLGIGQKVGAESPEQGNSYGRPLPSGSADFHQMQQGPL